MLPIVYSNITTKVQSYVPKIWSYLWVLRSENMKLSIFYQSEWTWRKQEWCQGFALSTDVLFSYFQISFPSDWLDLLQVCPIGVLSLQNSSVHDELRVWD